MKTSLLLLPRPVFPVVSGYSLKNYNLVRILSGSYHLTVGIITQGTVTEEERAYYRDLGVRWFVYRIPKLKSYVNTLFGILSDRPLQVSYYYDRGLQKKVDEEAEKADVLIAALIRTRAYLDPWKAKAAGTGNGKTVVFDMVDSIAMNYARSAASTASLFWRMIYRVEEKRLARYEKKWIEESSVTYLFNPEEQKALRKYGRVICLPHGVDDRLFSYEAGTNNAAGGTGAAAEPAAGAETVPAVKLLPHSVVFMGKMDYQPNVDAALWYLKNVHAKIGAKVPFVIVGAYPTEEIRKTAAQYPNVTVTGFVEDPYAYAAQAMAMAAPMQSGGGIQNKVLEGMALGKVNIVSSLAAAALEGVVPGEELLIADTPEEYAEILTDMCRREEEKAAAAASGKAETGEAVSYDAIGLKAREYIRGRYTWEKYGEGYLAGISSRA